MPCLSNILCVYIILRPDVAINVIVAYITKKRQICVDLSRQLLKDNEYT